MPNLWDFTLLQIKPTLYRNKYMIVFCSMAVARGLFISKTLIIRNMKNYAFCPISDNKINERVARINGVLTVLILLAFGYTHNILFIVFLGIDFLFRATSYSSYSLLGITSRAFLKYLPFETQWINAGPKIFAARIGLLFTSLIFFSALFSLSTASLVIAAILALFSFLEGAFGICVACIIYPYIYKLIYQTKFR